MWINGKWKWQTQTWIPKQNRVSPFVQPDRENKEKSNKTKQKQKQEQEQEQEQQTKANQSKAKETMQLNDRRNKEIKK